MYFSHPARNLFLTSGSHSHLASYTYVTYLLYYDRTIFYQVSYCTTSLHEDLIVPMHQ